MIGWRVLPTFAANFGAVLTFALWLSGWAAQAHDAPSCEPVYRLYRTHVPNTGLFGRVYVATFDSCDRAPRGAR